MLREYPNDCCEVRFRSVELYDFGNTALESLFVADLFAHRHDVRPLCCRNAILFSDGDSSACRGLRGVALKSKSKCVDEVVSLLVQGIEVRADDGEVFRAFKRAKAAGYFLLHFWHPDGTFAEIVGKGN